eukprot:1008287-Amphidinium_carterae.1
MAAYALQPQTNLLDALHQATAIRPSKMLNPATLAKNEKYQWLVSVCLLSSHANNLSLLAEVALVNDNMVLFQNSIKSIAEGTYGA